MTGKIVALQVENRLEIGLISDNTHLLYILESTQVFKRIHIIGSKDQVKVNVDMIIDLNYHPGAKKMFNFLSTVKWNSLVLNESAVITLE